MKTIDWKSLVYWGATILFSGLMLLSAAMYLSGAAASREGLAHLGYPPYLLAILGTAKLLGAPTLLQNRVPTLREWAYAGFAFDLIGATASHLFSGDPLGVAIMPFGFLLLLAVSYRLKPAPGTATATFGRRAAIA
jgi:DoxX-like family